MSYMLILFQGFQKYEEDFDPYSMVMYIVGVVYCLQFKRNVVLSSSLLQM